MWRARMGIFLMAKRRSHRCPKALTTTEHLPLPKRAQCGLRFGCAVCEYGRGTDQSNINAPHTFACRFHRDHPAALPCSRSRCAMTRFIAYLNGVEQVRVNAPATPA